MYMQAKELETKRALRDTMSAEVSAKRKFMAGLAGQLQLAAAAVDTSCLQLGVPPLTPAPQFSRDASLLPQPLFTLYWQLLSASHAFHLGLHVSLAGEPSPTRARSQIGAPLQQHLKACPGGHVCIRAGRNDACTSSCLRLSVADALYITVTASTRAFVGTCILRICQP